MTTTTLVADKIEEVVASWRQQLLNITPSFAHHKPSAERWSISEVVGHLVDSACNNHQRFARAQFCTELTFPKYEQNEWVSAANYVHCDWETLVELWAHYNRQMAVLIRNIPPSALPTPCTITPCDTCTLEFLISDYLTHLKHHLTILSERIEAREPETGPSTSRTGSVETSFLLAAKGNLESSAAKIHHCVDQLDDNQLWWRPTPSQNSIGNLILHLCGNLGQWIIAGVGGAEYVRDRPREFVDDKRFPKAEMSAMLNTHVEQAGSTLKTTSASAVMSARRIQGYDTTVLSAVLDAISHFQGHTQEIISLTRQQLGDRYAFDFIPTTPEQISERSSK